MLRKYVSSNGKDWDVKLPLVLMAIRATPHRTTGVTPFEMMTGREMTLPMHLLYRPEDVSVATAYTAHQYVSDLHHHLQSTFAWAQGNLEGNVRRQKAYYDKKASDREYPIGAKILYFNFTKTVGVSKKFLPNWLGGVRWFLSIHPPLEWEWLKGLDLVDVDPFVHWCLVRS